MSQFAINITSSLHHSFQLHHQYFPSLQSYGGHYVPWLANAVVEYNNKSPSQPINIQGFMVGNPWTDPASDNWGAATFW